MAAEITDTELSAIVADLGWLPIYIAVRALVHTRSGDIVAAQDAIAELKNLPESRGLAMVLTKLSGALSLFAVAGGDERAQRVAEFTARITAVDNVVHKATTQRSDFAVS